VAYDQQVLAEMFKDHDSLNDLIAIRLTSCPLLEDYARRLNQAYAHINAGDHQFVTGALIDSYHTVWFEFHEALIRLSGRDRATEAAAGRAD
jgi:pyruvate,orthophosphate dikinase